MASTEAYTLTRAIAYAENGEFRNISVLSGIATVSLEGVPVADAGVTVLADAFSPTVPVPHVIRLALGAAEITSVGASALAGALRASGNTIVSLRLDWNALGDDGATSLGRALRGNQRLEVLGLERCGVGDAGAVELASALGGSAPAGDAADPVASALPALRELHLEGNAIGAAGATAIATALRSNTRLQTLALALNPIGAEGARRLAAALRHNTALTVLDLSDCGVGDAGAEALGAALRGNTVLRELRLQGNGIGQRGAAAIAGALRINPAALRTLNLRLNRLDAHAGTMLLEAVRHAKTTPEAGSSLSKLHLEYCHVESGLGAEGPDQINATLLAALDGVLRRGDASTASTG